MEISTAEPAKEQPLSDDEILRQAQERLLRKRAELGIKDKPKSICTRAVDLEDSEESEEFKESKESEESPSGDLPPSAQPSRAVSKDSNTKGGESATTLLTASVESELSARGGGTEAERLFRQGRYNEISAAEFIQLAWEAAAGNSWQETGCSETWEFCRYLFAHSKFQNLRGGRLVKVLRRLIDLEEDMLELIALEIERVKYAQGAGPLEWAVLMSCHHGLSDPEDSQLEGYNKFLSIAGWLQVSQVEKPIVLPVEKLAKELGVTRQLVSHWRQRAQRQGLLKEVGHYVAHKQATRFRFAVERFSILRERGNL